MAGWCLSLNYVHAHHEQPHHRFSCHPALRLVLHLHHFGKAERVINLCLLSQTSLKAEPGAMGSMAHRAARMRSAGWGGPVVLSIISPPLLGPASHLPVLGRRDGGCCLPAPALSIGVPLVSLLLGHTTPMVCQRSTGFFSRWEKLPPDLMILSQVQLRLTLAAVKHRSGPSDKPSKSKIKDLASMLPCKDIEFLGREINLISLTSTVPAHLCQTHLPSHPFLLQPFL